MARQVQHAVGDQVGEMRLRPLARGPRLPPHHAERQGHVASMPGRRRGRTARWSAWPCRGGRCSAGATARSSASSTVTAPPRRPLQRRLRRRGAPGLRPAARRPPARVGHDDLDRDPTGPVRSRIPVHIPTADWRGSSRPSGRLLPVPSRSSSAPGRLHRSLILGPPMTRAGRRGPRPRAAPRARRPRRCAPPAGGAPRRPRAKRATPMPATPSRMRQRLDQPGLLCPGGRSTWVGSPVITMRVPSPMRVRNIFICAGVVFCASSRMAKACARVRPRMKASGAISISPDTMPARHLLGRHHVVQRVVERAQIGIDLLLHVAGQEAQPLAGLHRRAGQHDPVHPAGLQQRHPLGHREVGLAGAGRADAEHHLVPRQHVHVGAPARGVRGAIAPLRVRIAGQVGQRQARVLRRLRRRPCAAPPRPRPCPTRSPFSSRCHSAAQHRLRQPPCRSGVRPNGHPVAARARCAPPAPARSAPGGGRVPRSSNGSSALSSNCNVTVRVARPASAGSAAAARGSAARRPMAAGRGRGPWVKRRRTRSGSVAGSAEARLRTRELGWAAASAPAPPRRSGQSPVQCTGCSQGERPATWPGCRPGPVTSTSHGRARRTRRLNAPCCSRSTACSACSRASFSASGTCAGAGRRPACRGGRNT